MKFVLNLTENEQNTGKEREGLKKSFWTVKLFVFRTLKTLGGGGGLPASVCSCSKKKEKNGSMKICYPDSTPHSKSNQGRPHAHPIKTDTSHLRLRPGR